MWTQRSALNRRADLFSFEQSWSKLKLMGEAEYLLTYPRVFFVFSLVLLWLSALLGVSLRRRWPLKEDVRDDFGTVQAATLTLLGLIIGFSFSMAVTRYDLRKTYEEAEANAIGTEYVRADLIPATGAVTVRAQLRKYLDLRILFYRTRNRTELGRLVPIPLNCSKRCGLPFRLQLWSDRHP